MHKEEFPVFTNIVSLMTFSGAILCLAAVLILAWRTQVVGQTDCSQAAIATETTRLPRRPLDALTERIVCHLVAENGGNLAAGSRRLPGALTPSQHDRLLSADVASGLLVLAREAPQIAAHQSSIALLAQLRAVTGSIEFEVVCAELATLIHDRDPRYVTLASGLKSGDLSWSGFVAELRRLPSGPVAAA